MQDEASYIASVLTTQKVKQEKLAALTKISQECASLPTLDDHSADEILGYNNSPAGLWVNEFFTIENFTVSTHRVFRQNDLGLA